MLAEFVREMGTKFEIPGVAVGIWADGQEIYACHGVTSLDNPRPVDQDTVFDLGSVSKTYTATALMRLVAEGKVELEAPVRRYVPELVLSDEGAAAEITVLNLLNHTAGLDWRLMAETGDGDDALAAYVARMDELVLIARPGERASYSQAGYNLIGRIIENVTGMTYEQAVAKLLFEPVGLTNSVFALEDVLARRSAEGHNLGEDGNLSGVGPWKDTRANNPGAGVASSVVDQLRWARFHLADGLAEDGQRVVPAETLRSMREPTVALRASSLGDAFGICWFLREVGGVRAAGHGGSSNGQFAELLLVPERNFAIVSLTNADPNGILFNQALVRWALEHYLGVIDRDPEPLPYDQVRAEEVAGVYENDVMNLVVATDGAGLTLGVEIKPELRAASDEEMPADVPPSAMGLLPGDDDEYIVTEGSMSGQRGYFSRDAAGAIVGIDLAGRLFSKV